jgi:hypothetical protein
MRAVIGRRINENVSRVKNLMAIYENHLMGVGQGRRGHLQTDVLRASVVFLHASLEDFLRSLAYWKLPLAGKNVIDSVPLVGSGGDAKKFFLGELVAHRGKTVDQLIKESVNEHLERSNYNNTNELASFLESIGVVVGIVNGRFKDLDALMSRRHQIVHRGDIDETGGSGNSRVRSIGRSTVWTWISAVEDFSQVTLGQV